MGISGLLPMLKEISTPIHIQEWKGKTLAVDGYVWLHKGAYGCAEDLARGKPTLKYVNYAMHRVRLLKHFGITPLIVFDGGLLPSKRGTEVERERRRTAALARALELAASGKASQAREHFVRAVDVSPAHAYQLIKALRKEGVQYIVAPYEADPQLAYLERHGIVDGIITEDSDLLIFGCRSVLFKLDNDGQCVEVRRERFTSCREYNFAGWTDTEFRQMAILSGCDYLDSIPGIGLKKAYQYMRKHKTAKKVVQIVRVEGNLSVPKSYLDDFERAERTFMHQRVWDPVAQRLTHLTDLPNGLSADEMPFIGEELEQEYARGVALGEIDPITKEKMVDLVPDQTAAKAYTPQGFYKTAKASKATPVTGKASIKNFFGKVTPSPANAALKPRASTSQLPPLTAAAGATVDRTATVRTSKFFGGVQKSIDKEEKGKGKFVEIVIDDDEEDDEDDLVVVEPPAKEEDSPLSEPELILIDDDEDEPFEQVDAENLSEEEEDEVGGMAVGIDFDRLGEMYLRESQEAEVVATRERRSSIVSFSSVAPISSPPCSPPPPEQPTSSGEKKRLRTDENDPSGRAHPKQEELTQPVSSPAPTPVKVRSVQQTSRVQAVVRTVQLSDLSSDPITGSSDVEDGPATRNEDEVTPRADKRIKMEQSTLTRKRSFIDRGSSSQSPEEVEEPNEQTQAVLTDWKTRFMSSTTKPSPGSIARAKSTPNVSALAGPKATVTPRPLAGRASLGSRTTITPTPAVNVVPFRRPSHAPVPLQSSGTKVPPRMPFVARTNILDVPVESKKVKMEVGVRSEPSSEESSEGSDGSFSKLQRFAWRGSQAAV